MKFGTLFKSLIVDEWRGSYIDYGALKHLFESISGSAGDDDDEIDEVEVGEVRDRFLSESFWNIEDRALGIVENILSDIAADPSDQARELLAMIEGRPTELDLSAGRPLLQSDAASYRQRQFCLEALLAEIDKAGTTYQKLIEQESNVIEAICQRNAPREEFIEAFRRLHMVLNFSLINFQATRKLGKKFDKAAGTSSVCPTLIRVLKGAAVFGHIRVMRLIKLTVLTFANQFEGGDHHLARVFLLTKMTRQDFTKRDVNRLAFKSVCCIALLIAIVCLTTQMHFDHDDRIIVESYRPLYRAVLAIAFLLWLWGTAIFLFERFRINFVYIFEFDPESRLTFFQVFEEAANLTIGSQINMFVFIATVPLTSEVVPQVLLMWLLLKLLLPFPNLSSHWPTRKFLLKSLGNIVIAPFGRFRFADFLLGDVLTSMVKVFADLVAGICFMLTAVTMDSLDSRLNLTNRTKTFTTPFVSALPLFWRFAQCLRRYYDTGQRFPHIANAAKYLLSHTVILFSVFHSKYSNGEDGTWTAFRYVWLASFLISTLYVYAWDVTMDWSLLRTGFGSGSAPLLRKELMFGRPVFYYAAILLDFVLRFLWTVSLMPSTSNPLFIIPLESDLYQNMILPFLMILEIFRRCMWALFRVENEHVGNADDFRSHDVPVPMYFDSFREQKRRVEFERHQRGAGTVAELVLMGLLLIAFGLVATFGGDRNDNG